MRVTLSGFEPFDNLSENSSKILVEELGRNYKNPSIDLNTIVLPVSFESAFNKLKISVDVHQSDIIIATGLAFKRSKLTPERIAINYLDARIPDNYGSQPRKVAIDPKGPDGIFSNLPLDQMVEAAKQVGVAAEVSDTAGTYVCNDLMYKILKHYKPLGKKCGFIHLPPIQEMFQLQKDQAIVDQAISLKELSTGIEAMLNSLALRP